MANPYKIVKDFEETIAEYAGAKYGVAVESCCAAIFLSLQSFNIGNIFTEITIPKMTYPGVAMAIANSNNHINFTDKKWRGIYRLDPTTIIDSALRFRKGMYIKKTLYCLSFHYKKHLPIGRGGMILTDDKKIYNWFKMARFDGRKETPLSQDNAAIIGWNMYMTPEQAARGLELFETIKNKNLSDLKVKDQHYPDLSKWRCFR